MAEDYFFDEDFEMTKAQIDKQQKITLLLGEIYGKKGFDLPYWYNGFDDNLYLMNKSGCLKVGLSIDEINHSTITRIIEKLNKIHI